MASEKATANFTELPQFADQLSVRLQLDLVFVKDETTTHITDESTLAGLVRSVLADAVLDNALLADRPLVRLVVTRDDGRLPSGMVTKHDLYKIYEHS